MPGFVSSATPAPRTPPPEVRPRLRDSLRLQLLLPIAALVVVMTWVQVSTELRSSRAEILDGATRLARAMLSQVTENVTRESRRDDRADAEAVVGRLGTLPELEVAALLDAKGRVITSTRYELRGLPWSRTSFASGLTEYERGSGSPIRTFARKDGLRILAVAPVEGPPGESARRLVMQYDISPRIETERSAIIRKALWMGLVRLLVLALLALVLEVRVARPAARIAEAARRLGAGDRTVRTGVRGRSELELAAQSFDGMAGQLEASEKELHRTRSIIDGLLRSLPVGVIVVRRRDLKLLFANPQWGEFYGMAVERVDDYEVLCDGVGLERPDGSPYPRHLLTVPLVLQTGRPAHVGDLVILRQNGTRIPLMATGVPVNFGGGPEFDAVVCVAQDRRELDRAFRELAEWERRFETAIAATGQVVYEWDIAVGTVRRSGSVLSVLGIPDRETPEGLHQWHSHLHPEDLKRVAGELEACLREHRTFEAEYRFRRGDGRWIYIRDRGFFQYAPNGTPMQMLGTMVDVTERHNLEQQLRHAQKMETVGTLAGGIAHDFNNQLTGVMGHLDLLGVELDADDPRREHVRFAYRAAERCAELTSGLLAFSRRLTSHPRPVQLNSIVTETVGLLRHTLPATVRLATALEPELWTSLADPGQLQQVLMNLCVNARDAMPDGGELLLGTRNVTIGPDEVGRHPGAQRGEFVELRVHDSGCGIAADTLPRIFEPFFTTKSVGAGTGLGLAMVYGIVSAHHGWVEIDSTPGQGATFRVLLPRAQGAPPDLEAERRLRPRGGRETVLVVDDEPAVRDLATRALAGAGYQVVCAHDGDEALAIYRTRTDLGRGTGAVELVLLDLTMPGKPGRQVLAEMLTLDPQARVILSTGFTNGPGIADLGQLGFLSKPYRVHDLLDLVRRTLDRPARIAREESAAGAHSPGGVPLRG
jgi:PAS domain S-box-containing protein